MLILLIFYPLVLETKYTKMAEWETRDSDVCRDSVIQTVTGTETCIVLWVSVVRQTKLLWKQKFVIASTLNNNFTRVTNIKFSFLLEV